MIFIFFGIILDYYVADLIIFVFFGYILYYLLADLIIFVLFGSWFDFLKIIYSKDFIIFNIKSQQKVKINKFSIFFISIIHPAFFYFFFDSCLPKYCIPILIRINQWQNFLAYSCFLLKFNVCMSIYSFEKAFSVFW